MPLDRVPLRLPPHLHQRVKLLLHDRGLNVCLVRAIEQWCIREEALEEEKIFRLHEARSAYDAPGAPVKPVTRAPVTNGGSAPRKPEPVAVVAEPEPEAVPPEPTASEPRTRRPPRSAEMWGASASEVKEVGGDESDDNA